MKKLFDATNRYIETSDWKIIAVLKFCLISLGMMIGIILATGVYMILHNCLGSVTALSPDTTAVVMTAALAAVYFGSRKILRNGISPIALIGISAVAGILVYGL